MTGSDCCWCGGKGETGNNCVADIIILVIVALQVTAALQAASTTTLAIVGSVADVPLFEKVLGRHQYLSPPMKQAECCALENSII